MVLFVYINQRIKANYTRRARELSKAGVALRFDPLYSDGCYRKTRDRHWQCPLLRPVVLEQTRYVQETNASLMVIAREIVIRQ
jgi:hypothetical protein